MKVLAIVFLLGLTASANSEKCPRSADLKPCHCGNMRETGNIMVRCSDDSMDLIKLNNSLNSLVGKKNVELELEYLDLGTIPSNFFAGIEIVRMEITHCELDELTEDESLPPLQGLEDSLQELTIIYSFTEKNVPAKLKLDHLNKLEELYLSTNTITEMGNDWFEKGPASLESLTIISNGIEKIGDKVFANLNSLQSLTINGNRFGMINRTMLPSSADDLESLDMDNNALERLPEDIFTNMPKLDFLSLRDNGIARLDEKTWTPVWAQLDTIFLEDNPLECDSHMAWMFDLKRTSAIYGRCEAPKDKRGIHLQDFIDDKGE